MVGAAIVGSAVVGAVASGIAGSAASSAQRDAARRATNAQMQMYNQTRSDLMPYQQAGQSAINPLLALAGVSGDSSQIQQTLENMPGYQFTLNQGLKATQNSAAARGLGSSGAALKGAASYATGLAQSNYNNYFNQLMGISQLGENAAAQTGAYGTQTANNVGNNMIGAGNATAASYMNWGNQISNAANSIGSYYGFRGMSQS